MTVVEKAVQWAIATANDNGHGYSQASRWGPDYDCSSFVITAYRQAGLKLTGATYTGNMRSAFLADGFADVTYEVGLSSGYNIQAGDVLLNYSAHTCISIGGGRVANCRTDEGHPQSGDQSGNEIRIQSYWDGSPNRWNCVLRYKGNEQVQNPDITAPENPVSSEKGDSLNLEDHIWKPEMLKYGSRGADVCVLQSLLVAKRFFTNSNPREVDGDFGAKTQAAVTAAQRFYGLETDGICGPDTWSKLLEVG